MHKDRGLLIVLSGPSGAGKGTVIAPLTVPDSKIKLSISVTTRPPREYEKDGVNYYFKTKEEFEALIEQGQFLEYTKYCGNYYGTLKQTVEELIKSGRDVVLEIETDGATQIKNKFQDAVLIFVMTPSLNELEKRLVYRNTEDKTSIKKRLYRSLSELEQIKLYDYVVINDYPENAADKIKSIIRAEKAKTSRMMNMINEVILNDKAILKQNSER